MKLYNLVQGSPEWHAFRAERFTASDAPAMMGFSKYKTRTQLLDEKKTGIVPEVDASTQKRFDDGHASEAKACAVLEKLTGFEFFPVTGTHDELEHVAASLDGITDAILCDSLIIFEHKLYNKKLIEYIEAHNDLPDTHWPQVEQQLFVSGAEYCKFVVSDGGEENRFELDYYSRADRIEDVLAGWDQFEKDLEAHVPAEPEVKAVAKLLDAPMNILVRVSGEVEESNLPEVREAALAVFESINLDLKTDQDFADAEATAKWCKTIEEKLAAAKENALAQTKSIDELFSTINSISDQASSIRLKLSKLVKEKKLSRKREIAAEARQSLLDHVQELNAGCENLIKIPVVDIDGAMKGKRTISSLVDAANGAVAQAKIELTKQAQDIETNLAAIDAAGEEYKFLFNDRADLVTMSPQYLPLEIKKRVDEYKIEQEKREQEVAEKAKQKAIEETQAVAHAAEDETNWPEPAERSAPVYVAPAKQRVRVEEGKKRPSDSEIVSTLCSAYKVSGEVVISWLADMNLNQPAKAANQ